MAVERKRDRNKPLKRTSSKTKKQIAVICLLVLGLIMALATQPKKGEVALLAQPTVTLTQLKSDFVPASNTTEPHPSVLQMQTLTSVDLATWVDQNPFAASHSETINKSFSDANGSLRIQAVYGQGDNTVALIGTHLVRVGESLPDGRRVLSISADGIELSR